MSWKDIEAGGLRSERGFKMFLLMENQREGRRLPGLLQFETRAEGHLKMIYCCSCDTVLVTLCLCFWHTGVILDIFFSGVSLIFSVSVVGVVTVVGAVFLWAAAVWSKPAHVTDQSNLTKVQLESVCRLSFCKALDWKASHTFTLFASFLSFSSLSFLHQCSSMLLVFKASLTLLLSQQFARSLTFYLLRRCPSPSLCVYHYFHKGCKVCWLQFSVKTNSP